MVEVGTRIRVTDDLSTEWSGKSTWGRTWMIRWKVSAEDRLGMGSIQEGRI